MPLTETRPEPGSLPILRPTLPGCVAGYVDDDPPTLQCQECGLQVSHQDISMVVLTSGVHFHGAAGWPDGTNPRLCRGCRLARGCKCLNCEYERRSYAKRLG